MIRLLALFILLPLTGLAQNYAYFAGGRSAALAHSSVALTDIWASHHNQAALGFLQEPAVGVSYENRYFMSDLALGNAAFAYPSKLGTVGLALSYFGFDLYNESKIGLSYARAFGKYFSLGLQLNYQSYHVAEGTAGSGAVTFEAGILAKPLKDLNIGFHVYNPSGNFKNAETDERLPLMARLGALYTFNEDFGITAEVKKNENAAERYAAGFEYRVVQMLIFRTGISLQPLSNTFGLGIDLGSFTTDMSFEYAQVLGSNANISLQYAF